MDVKFSTHLKNRARERGISEKDVLLTLESPDGKKQQYKGTHGGFVSKYWKTIEGKKLAVIAEMYKNLCYVISTFYEA